MLCCEKSKVIKLYKKFQKDGTFTCLYAAGVLDTLFGSKCLPDEKGIDIAKLDKMLDETLEKETADSLNEWTDSREELKFEEE